ncbi:MAG: DUF417 family protein [Caulobacteraceae bacterium]
MIDSLLLKISRFRLFQGDLEYKLLRGVMVLTFYSFGIQKWNAFTSQMLVPLISHSPIVFWIEPAFGVRGAGFFLGTSELTFGTLILLGYWSKRIGILGALGSTVTFLGTVGIIFFLPDAWAKEAGGFPIMTLPLGFLWKDFLFLAVSLYLLKMDVMRAAAEIGTTSLLGFPRRGHVAA